MLMFIIIIIQSLMDFSYFMHNSIVCKKKTQTQFINEKQQSRQIFVASNTDMPALAS